MASTAPAEAAPAELEPVAADADSERNRAIELQRSLRLEQFISSVREEPNTTSVVAVRENGLAETVKAVRSGVEAADARIELRV